MFIVLWFSHFSRDFALFLCIGKNVKGRKKCVLLWRFLYVLATNDYVVVSLKHWSHNWILVSVWTRTENVHNIVHKLAMCQWWQFKAIQLLQRVYGFSVTCQVTSRTYFSTIKAWPRVALRCVVSSTSATKPLLPMTKWKRMFQSLCCVQRVYFIHCAVWFASKGSACDL